TRFDCDWSSDVCSSDLVRNASRSSAPPTPAAVAALEPADLIPLQFSRQKADYVIATARLVASGALDLEALRTMSATRAERTLLEIGRASRKERAWVSVR